MKQKQIEIEAVCTGGTIIGSEGLEVADSQPATVDQVESCKLLRTLISEYMAYNPSM